MAVPKKPLANKSKETPAFRIRQVSTLLLSATTSKFSLSLPPPSSNSETCQNASVASLCRISARLPAQGHRNSAKSVALSRRVVTINCGGFFASFLVLFWGRPRTIDVETDSASFRAVSPVAVSLAVIPSAHGIPRALPLRVCSEFNICTSAEYRQTWGRSDHLRLINAKRLMCRMILNQPIIPPLAPRTERIDPVWVPRRPPPSHIHQMSANPKFNMFRMRTTRIFPHYLDPFPRISFSSNLLTVKHFLAKFTTYTPYTDVSVLIFDNAFISYSPGCDPGLDSSQELVVGAVQFVVEFRFLTRTLGIMTMHSKFNHHHDIEPSFNAFKDRNRMGFNRTQVWSMARLTQRPLILTRSLRSLLWALYPDVPTPKLCQFELRSIISTSSLPEGLKLLEPLDGSREGSALYFNSTSIGLHSTFKSLKLIQLNLASGPNPQSINPSSPVASFIDQMSSSPILFMPQVRSQPSRCSFNSESSCSTIQNLNKYTIARSNRFAITIHSPRLEFLQVNYLTQRPPQGSDASFQFLDQLQVSRSMPVYELRSFQSCTLLTPYLGQLNIALCEVLFKMIPTYTAQTRRVHRGFPSPGGSARRRFNAQACARASHTCDRSRPSAPAGCNSHKSIGGGRATSSRQRLRSPTCITMQRARCERSARMRYATSQAHGIFPSPTSGASTASSGFRSTGRRWFRPFHASDPPAQERERRGAARALSPVRAGRIRAAKPSARDSLLRSAAKRSEVARASPPSPTSARSSQPRYRQTKTVNQGGGGAKVGGYELHWGKKRRGHGRRSRDLAGSSQTGRCLARVGCACAIACARKTGPVLHLRCSCARNLTELGGGGRDGVRLGFEGAADVAMASAVHALRFAPALAVARSIECAGARAGWLNWVVDAGLGKK
ncbi:hypothetical protein DFH06DRAFT_1415998 [Mycena polygramma]|nr:hypothetical protein DFH06DRAFT_1415998 [Mycena polygramma]